MPDNYDVTLSIIVNKEGQEVLVDEKDFFRDQTFAKMANIANEFYELLAKLKKTK